MTYFCPKILRALWLMASFFFCLSHAFANLGQYQNPWDTQRSDYLQLGISANRYISDSSSQSISDIQTGRMAFTAAGRTSSAPEKMFQGTLEAELGFGLRDSLYRYIDAPEFNLSLNKKTDDYTVKISIGRKLEDWSRYEDFWALGLYQPRFRWDDLDVRTNGLTGLFADINTEYVQATAYFTPIFIPEQGAAFSLAGGQCRTSSAWFNCPGSTISLFNQNTSVYYKLEMPSAMQFINRPGRGASIRFGKERGFWLRTSYAHKAINQVFLAYTGYLNLSTEALPATIYARAMDHELVSAEAGYTAPRWSLLMSGIAEHPLRDATPASWTTQEESNSVYYGPILYTRPFGTGEGETRFDLGYLKRIGGNPTETGPFANPDASVFEPRHNYAEAYSFGMRTPLVEAWGHNFWWTERFVVDTANKGNILVSDVNIRPLSTLVLNIGLDLLGSASPRTVDFISKFQRNDRIRGGLKYAF